MNTNQEIIDAVVQLFINAYSETLRYLPATDTWYMYLSYSCNFEWVVSSKISVINAIQNTLVGSGVNLKNTTIKEIRLALQANSALLMDESRIKKKKKGWYL